MKKCPYCFELVQEDALKCKHCNEWFDKENHSKKGIKNLFNSVSNKIDTIKEERNRKKTEHLFIPTNENPMIFEGITFYGDRFKTDKEEIFYYQITNIDFRPSSSTFNFVTSYSLRFGIYYIVAENEEEVAASINANIEPKFILIADSTFDFDSAIIKSTTIAKKQMEQFNVVNNVLSKRTYYLRALRYIDNLSMGYVKYYHIDSVRHNKILIYKFHLNGNVERNGKLITNILTDYDKQEILSMLVLGTRYSTGYGMNYSHSSNPYELILRNKYAKWYNIFDKKVVISTSIDKDIFAPIMFEFIKTGVFPKPNQIKDNENEVEY